jgi:multidrug resistance efflux pump
MARQNAVGRVLGVLTIVAMLALAFWLTPNRQMSSAQDRTQSNSNRPLIARGYTDATAGTYIVAGDPIGGQSILELRIKDGQTVKEGDIIAVLSNYPRAEILVRMAEATVQQIKNQREIMLTGTRITQLEIAEAGIKSTIDANRLGALERLRSAKPADQKELEVSIIEQRLANQEADLELQKRALKNDLAMNEFSMAEAESRLKNALADREAALVRSPVDGIIAEIYTRQGEVIPGHPGIAKIVDMSQLRVIAEVDELHLPSLVPGRKVEVTFRGSPQVYGGHIVRTPMTVTRVKRSKADLGLGNTHTVEVEIAFDNPSTIPQMLEREARVTFL